MKTTRLVLLVVLALAGLIPALAQDAAKPVPAEAPQPERNPKATPPEQPEKGPGGKEYAHKAVSEITAGEDGEQYWLFQPAEPAPEKAPVVVFVHGFGAMEPKPYRHWIEHLCKRGNLVIYPRYQGDLFEAPANYAPNAAKAAVAALAWLEADKKRVQPIRDKFALAGHSAGGVTAANLAARYDEFKLPKPLALMSVQPGATMLYDRQHDAALIPLADFGKIPAGVLLLCIYSDSDTVVGDYLARKIFVEASAVKPADKNLVQVRSDLYGQTPLIAHHTTASSRDGSIDVFDWYAYWKLLDGLCDAAFSGKNRIYALGDTAEQRFMGRFSDGHPVAELKVTLGDAKHELKADYTPRFTRDGKPYKADPK